MSGARAVVDALETLGVRHAFGLPGERNIDLLDALRGSSVELVVPTHELAATFMATGYARRSGRVGIVVAIPGPGIAYTLAGLLEAQHDSAPLLVLTAPPREGGAFPLQRFDHAAVLGPAAKAIHRAAENEAGEAVRIAHAVALAGEPGPVVLELGGGGEGGSSPSAHADPPGDGAVRELAARLAAAARPVVLVGQGAADAAAEIRELVARTDAAVLATTSGRGVVAEDDPHSLVVDAAGYVVEATNAVMAQADLVLALGCKFSHNGTLGYRLSLDPARLVHVDSSPASLDAGGAGLRVRADVPTLVAALLAQLPPREAPAWTGGELAARREALAAGLARAERTAPRLPGVGDESAAGFFGALRRVLPPGAALVTDSGLHQQLARRHFAVLEPRTLVVPADFQSMGFGLPAAIGAALAAPSTPVVALVGDGGFAMTGLELLTAVRYRLPVTVIVFNDGQLGLIRLEQLARFGRTHAVETTSPDLELFARSVGARYARVQGDPEAALRAAVDLGAPTLLEVVLGDSARLREVRAAGVARRVGRGLRGRG